MSEELVTENLFEPAMTYPDAEAAERLAGLVGLDEHKERLHKMLTLLVVPNALLEWATEFHGGASNLVNTVLSRPPLVVLAGDVGCGKTVLAETIADGVARERNIDITLFPMSLSARGKGKVGEMTQLLSAAFDRTYSEARKVMAEIDGEESRGAVILLIDEADALAQSREAAQMHHEDRAGVNALIRGVDRLTRARLPVAVIMCTNRPGALDPAVQRRAADILDFHRPDRDQRAEVLGGPLRELGFGESEIEAIVEATGPGEGGKDHPDKAGFTFSDLTQRLLPTIVLNAFPSQAVEPEAALMIARAMRPTRAFGER